MSQNNVVCFRCEADKRKIKTTALHSILCEHATKDEIEQAGKAHTSTFAKIWAGVQSWLNIPKD